jgi:hypothetical protein
MSHWTPGSSGERTLHVNVNALTLLLFIISLLDMVANCMRHVEMLVT